MKGRNWSLRSYLRVPSVSGSGHTLTVTTSPVLIFQYDIKTDYGVPRPTDNSFKINQRNIYNVLDFFREGLEWLTSNAYQALFIQDDKDGHLMVNMDYKDLQVMVKGSKYDAQALLAVPVVYVEDGHEEPGLGIAINRQEYAFAMKRDDAKAIYACLARFSFQAEAMMLMQLASNPALWEPETGMADPKLVPSSGSNFGSYDGSKKITW